MSEVIEDSGGGFFSGLGRWVKGGNVDSSSFGLSDEMISRMGNWIVELDDYVQNSITTIVAEKFNALATATSPLFTACVSLYFLYKIFQLMYSEKGVNILEFIKTMAVLAFINVLLYNSSLFSNSVAPIFINMGDGLSEVLTGTTGLGAISQNYIKLLKDLASAWSLLGESRNILTLIGYIFIVLIEVVILILGAGVMIIHGIYYILLSKIMLSILLTLGSIFIAFSFFETTRPMFSSWLSAVFNFTLLSSVFTLTYSLITGAIETLFETAEGFSQSLAAMIASLIFYFFGIMVLRSIPDLVRSLTGGISVGSLGEAGKSMSNTSKSLRTAGKGMQSLSKALSNTRIGRAIAGVKGTLGG